MVDWSTEYGSDVLHGTTYIDRCIRIVFSMNKKAVLIHSAPVPILDWDRDLYKISNILSHKASKPEGKWFVIYWVARQLAIPSETEFHMIALTYQNRLMTIEQIQTGKPINRLLTTRGIYEVQEYVLCRLLVTSVSKRAVKFPRNMLMAGGTKSSEWKIAY